MNFKYSIDQKEVAAVQKKMSSLIAKGLPDAAEKAVTTGLIYLTGQIKQRVKALFRSTQRESGGKYGIAAVGSLAASWSPRPEITKDGTKIIGTIGTWAKHAPTHEYGAPPVIIKPNQRQALTIPITLKAYPPASELAAAGLSFVKKDKIFLKAKGPGAPGSGAQPKAIFVLKKSVHIKKRPFIKPSVDAARDTIFKGFGTEVQSVLEKD